MSKLKLCVPQGRDEPQVQEVNESCPCIDQVVFILLSTLFLTPNRSRPFSCPSPLKPKGYREAGVPGQVGLHDVHGAVQHDRGIDDVCDATDRQGSHQVPRVGGRSAGYSCYDGCAGRTLLWVRTKSVVYTVDVRMRYFTGLVPFSY